MGDKAVKLASTTSGVAQKEIETLMNHTDEVLDLAKKYNNDIAAATDAKRVKWAQDISNARKGLNKQITEVLQSGAPKTPLDITGVIDEIEKIKTQLHPNYQKQAINEIDDLLVEIKKAETDLGGHSVGDLYALKSHLQDLAAGSYKKNGQIFQVGKDVQRAAKAGAANANKTLRVAAPEIKAADDGLSQLRRIEERLNKNILGEGKSNASLLAAGADQNQFQRGLLAKLDKLTGSTTLSDAEKLAAARTFGNPSFLPVDTTGKSLTRLVTGLGGGLLLGGPKGMIVGGAMTSPAAIKAAAQGRRAIKGLLKK